MEASIHGHAEVVKLLLDRGAEVDAKDKATGEAMYSCDVKIPGMLFGKCKRSPHPFARMLSIDVSKALKLPGVRAIVTARNVTQFHYAGLDQLQG
jgi:CO/xanthine dehydrogenase Mo-binding subunit